MAAIGMPSRAPLSNGQLSTEIRLGDYERVLPDICADLIFTSPPYNIGSKAPKRTGFRKLGQYDPKSYGAIRDYPDDVPERVYQDRQAAFLVWAATHLTTNGVLVYNHKPRRRNGVMIDPSEWYQRPEVRQRLTLVDQVVWDRGSTHNHAPGLIWPTTERLYVFRRADGNYRFRNTADLPHRSDIWRIPLNGRTNGHACPFPIKLALAVIQTWSSPGDMVCDPYLGSGTTAAAARELGRSFVGSEILPKYVEQAMRALYGDMECAA